MPSFIWWVLISYIFITIIVFFRFCNLGMIKRRAILRTFKFQYEIFGIHYRLFKKYQEEKLEIRLKLLLFPIVNLPNAIVSYAEMYIKMDVFEYAVKELLNELPDQEKTKLMESLVASGRISVKKRTKGNIDQDDIDVVKRYNDTFGSIFV